MSSSGKEPSSSSSPSSGTAGPGGPSGPPALPRPNAWLLLRLALAFAACLAAWYLLRGPYNHAVLGGAARLLALRPGAPKETITAEEGGFYLVTRLERAGRRGRMPLKNANILHWNLALFGALLCVAPRRVLRRRWGYVLAATLLLFASHVLFAWNLTLSALGQAYFTAGVPFLSERIMDAVAWAALLNESTLAPLLPFALAAPLFFARVPAARARPPAAGVPDRATGRNAPCPCGSGRKYKRCCGRAAR